MNGKVNSDNTQHEDVLIANPLYDHVFKYMMEDNPAACKFLSAIVDREITELSFIPREYVDETDFEGKRYGVYRLDFIARIRPKNNFSDVKIEIWKTLHTDVFWFRRYLDTHRNKANACVNSRRVPYDMAVYRIFILADGLGEKGIPVIKSVPVVTDMITGEILHGLDNEFINTLHPHTWIVQVPEPKECRRTDLEKLLSIFDQTDRMNDNPVLKIQAEILPEEYRPIIRRLQQAAQSTEILNAMREEDDVSGTVSDSKKIDSD